MAIIQGISKQEKCRYMAKVILMGIRYLAPIASQFFMSTFSSRGFVKTK